MVTAIQSHSGRLADKVAVVTGSSAGISRAITLAFAREGAKVVCSDLQPLAKIDVKDEAHVATHDTITKNGGIGVFVKANVEEAHGVEELVHGAVEILGEWTYSSTMQALLPKSRSRQNLLSAGQSTTY
ncbi:hypothetical protein DL95DRAFT_454505 [Leptodontidium sp. 2 PMI_412]|nr:hypothetical protein DL95DRAFT_454505 [Leptodontidium sp. 2 PMI_412]